MANLGRAIDTGWSDTDGPVGSADPKRPVDKSPREYAVFEVGEILCGVEIRSVREINRKLDITRVHLAPDAVRGVVNLRGQIVTVVDLRRKFHMPSRAFDSRMRIIVVRTDGEDIGLLVDSVSDIVPATTSRMERPPPHVKHAIGKYISGVYKMDADLVALLDVERILERE